MSHRLADRKPVVRWRSATGRICLLTIAADGTPEAYYEPRSDVELETTCETRAVELGMAEMRLALVLARRAIEAAKTRDRYLAEQLDRLLPDLHEDDRLTELSHQAADALTKFEREHGSGRPWLEDLAFAQERRRR